MEPEKDLTCHNCGAFVDGAYCSTCGQKHQQQRQSLGQFLKEGFSEYFGVDGRFWTTTKALLFAPGKLTNAWLRGQRTAYLRPLRIYLIATVTFFFLLSLIDPVGSLEEAVEQFTSPDTLTTVADQLTAIDRQITESDARLATHTDTADSLQSVYDQMRVAFVSDSTANSGSTSDLEDRRSELEDVADELEDAIDDAEDEQKDHELKRKRLSLQKDILMTIPPDSLIRPATYDEIASIAFPDGETNINLPSWMPKGKSVDRVNRARSTSEKAQAYTDLGRSIIERLPLAIFLMLPVFALILKIIYIRRDYFYTEHLVFGLHTHAFAFTIFSVSIILTSLLNKVDSLQGVNIVTLLGIGIAILYFVVATKIVYKQSWLKTLFKIFLLSTIYNGVIILAVLLAVILAATLG